ncbi:MAG: aryl-sulfate sulfotransferase [Candidatus Altiarchaeota archaeon]
MRLVAAVLIGIVLFSGCAQEEEVTVSSTIPENALEPVTVPQKEEATVSSTLPEETTIEPTILRGTPDSDFSVEVYKPDKAYAGTTLLPDNHNPGKPRVIEVNMLGEIVWEYVLPSNLRQYTNPGFDVELLSDDNIMFVLPRKGVYEINREGGVVWSYLDEKVSHDADRLSNGNTLVVFGNNDKMADAQVKEVSPDGTIVWSWHAKDHFSEEYKDISNQGWTHTNAVTRLENGNTLISPRNFDMLVEVDSQGSVVRTIGRDYLKKQHDPEILGNGNILLANHGTPHEVLEINPETDEIVWRFPMSSRKTQPVRDANRLPNGNTLITGSTVILEVTPDKEIVWKLNLKEGMFKPEESAERGFYKAERI